VTDEPEAFGCLPVSDRWLGPEHKLPLPGLDDEEGLRISPSLPPVVDAHVHLFPEPVFNAIWRWFEKKAWPIRYKLYSEQVLKFLLERGVQQVVGLSYSHQPGMAAMLNQHMAELAAKEPRLIGLATVLPGEPGASQILEDAFKAGLKGVKLHCHVQSFAPDARELDEIYETCIRWNRPITMHAGREPSSHHYKVDPYVLCAVERVERVLRNYPKLKLCVPHLGANEFDGYEKLLEQYENLWLDTTMAIAEYFPGPVPTRLLEVRPERILYGTDFPNLPYAWDRELKRLEKGKFNADALEKVCGKNARELFAQDQ
jgi:uncharacterized protein